jgi:hypothetical protein
VPRPTCGSAPCRRRSAARSAREDQSTESCTNVGCGLIPQTHQEQTPGYVARTRASRLSAAGVIL